MRESLADLPAWKAQKARAAEDRRLPRLTKSDLADPSVKRRPAPPDAPNLLWVDGDGWYSLCRIPIKGVYFACAETGQVKIGWSSCVGDRIGQLERQYRLSLLFLAVDRNATLEDERAYHLRFAADRLQGEWFRPSQAILDCVAELRQRG